MDDKFAEQMGRQMHHASHKMLEMLHGAEDCKGMSRLIGGVIVTAKLNPDWAQAWYEYYASHPDGTAVELGHVAETYLHVLPADPNNIPPAPQHEREPQVSEILSQILGRRPS